MGTTTRREIERKKRKREKRRERKKERERRKNSFNIHSIGRNIKSNWIGKRIAEKKRDKIVERRQREEN